MLKKTFNVTVITFWTSCLIIFFIVNQITSSNYSLYRITESFLLVSNTVLLFLIVFVLPCSLLTQLFLKKVPELEYKHVYKFLFYLSPAVLISFIHFIFWGLGFLSFLVIIIFYCVEEILYKYKKAFNIITRLSYIISSSILVLFLYQYLINTNSSY